MIHCKITRHARLVIRMVPSCDHVPAQLLPVFPRLGACEEIFGAADKTVGIVSVSRVSAAPDGHRNVGMKPDVPGGRQY